MIEKNIEEKIRYFEDLLDSYFISHKLRSINCEKRIIKNDRSVYDAFDNVDCYSIMLRYDLFELKLSINMECGELVLEIKDLHDEKVEDYFESLYDKYPYQSDEKNRISVSNTITFLAYFYNHDEKIEDIIKTYFSYKFN